MPLSPGTRLGSFDVVARLGAGGMGEVYRARDLRLQREVAIKVLPAALTDDPVALARFEREALAVAALSHPNIVAIHEFGRDAATSYVVMELLLGQNLRERLDEGPLSPGKTVEYGVALARGIAAAHDKGIVHRDLKPENVFLTDDGRVKILDFGLARRTRSLALSDDDPETTQIGVSANVTTNAGMVLGTIGYMSPEQVRGRDIDTRTDIFAFGAVLFEMVTGRRAFDRGTPADTITAVLNADPPDTASTGVVVPGTLDAIIRRCLEKDPGDRFQSMRDLAFALEAMRGNSGASLVGRAGPPRRARLPLAVRALLLALALAAAGAAGWSARRPVSSPAPGAVTFDIAIGRALGPPPFLAVSPDGRTLAFANVSIGERNGTFLRDLATTEMREIPDLYQSLNVFWSPDGREMAVMGDGQVRAYQPADGTIRRLCTFTGRTLGGSWSRDGRIVFAIEGQGLFTVPAAGGTAAPFAAHGADSQVRLGMWPHVLPDGRLLYWVQGGPRPRLGTLRVVGSGGEGDRAVMPADSGAQLAEGRYLLMSRAGQLVSQQVDPVTLAAVGEPFVIASRVFQSELAIGYAGFDVSPAGTVALFPGFEEPVAFEWFGRRGEALTTIGPVDRFGSFDLSPDESRVLAIRRDPSSDARSVWLLDNGTGVNTQLVGAERGQLSDPVWAPDGRRMAYRAGGQVVIRPVYGGSETTLVDGIGYPEHWSADGRYILFGRAVGGRYGMYAASVDGREQPALVSEATGVDEARFSPDVAWVAYHALVNGRSQVFLSPFPATGEVRQISSDGGVQPQWSRGGRELVYLDLAGRVMSVEFPKGIAAGPTAPRPLFDARLRVSGTLDQIRVARDGSRVLIQDPEGASGNRLRLIVHWPELLRARKTVVD